MIEISPEELLPENFADFKKQIPDLKIADRLSAENPLKPLLTAIENHRQSGMLFKTIVVLLLTYLTLWVAAAFFRGHPSAWGMLLLLLPVYVGAFLAWKCSPLAPYSLVQILLFFRTRRVLKKAFAERVTEAPKEKRRILKKIMIPFGRHFFLQFGFGHTEQSKSKAEKELTAVKQIVRHILWDRVVLIGGGAVLAVGYYQSAFFLSDAGYGKVNFWSEAAADLIFAGESFGPHLFITFFLLSLAAINLILYSGNIFLPYENARIRQFVAGCPQSLFERFVYLPLLNVFIFAVYLLFMFCAGSGIFALYASAFYLIPGTITILVLLVAFNLIFCFLFRLCVVLLRKTAFFINRFY